MAKEKKSLARVFTTQLIVLLGIAASLLLSGTLLAKDRAKLSLAGLDEAQKKQLRQGNILVQLEKVEGTGVKEGTAIGLIEAEPESVWQAIVDYDNYAEFMPRTLEARVVKRDGDQVDLFSRLNMPWPARDVSYVIRLKLLKKDWRVNWQMLPGTGEGVTANRGSWRLSANKTGHTLAVYRLFFTSEQKIPNYIVNAGTKSTLRRVIQAVRSRVASSQNDN